MTFFSSIPNPRNPTRFILFTGLPQEFFSREYHIQRCGKRKKEKSCFLQMLNKNFNRNRENTFKVILSLDLLH